MKYPEYDSPFELTISDIATQMSRNIDELSWTAIQRVGIDVDKDKLLAALKQDAERYREAYTNGHDTGYEERNEEIVRCKDCKHAVLTTKGEVKYCQFWQEDEDGNFGGDPLYLDGDFFCAGAERRETE